MKRIVLVLLALGSGGAQAAVAWAGVNASTSGYGVHAGVAVVPVPFVGTLGVEASAERAWSTAGPSRLAAGLTVRDLNLPLTRVDAFGTLGGEYRTSTASQPAALAAFAEAGLRGRLAGPAGWRAFARANTSGAFGAGLGLELRF
ncbi:hypothetical protein DEDE109153_01690 [Deinococcus deserti]|uniref:Outer membrane protein beta-barrel domain-containing protein n=1 Tax=Deinococcus deserti (strain DSM 17065 / CIP 109153 / LMG 22923 / VCD115) TaxID=546414 RepID=C1CVA8_DEIDV|nr:hypothetical protein [Deinococcus deserti]ACO46125.2 hypothetical protein Deide_12121 [Deinococcus deserti VCD115]